MAYEHLHGPAEWKGDGSLVPRQVMEDRIDYCIQLIEARDRAIDMIQDRLDELELEAARKRDEEYDRSRRSHDVFPVNDAGEPLMTPEGWRYEQYLNADADDIWDD